LSHCAIDVTKVLVDVINGCEATSVHVGKPLGVHLGVVAVNGLLQRPEHLLHVCRRQLGEPDVPDVRDDVVLQLPAVVHQCVRADRLGRHVLQPPVEVLGDGAGLVGRYAGLGLALELLDPVQVRLLRPAHNLRP
jgi:hypothetical protein